jgi:hypothetical protein
MRHARQKCLTKTKKPRAHLAARPGGRGGGKVDYSIGESNCGSLFPAMFA